ncbi:MAG: hypothetical protein ACXWH0_07755 [Acidimicrobiia bacterium]
MTVIAGPTREARGPGRAILRGSSFLVLGSSFFAISAGSTGPHERADGDRTKRIADSGIDEPPVVSLVFTGPSDDIKNIIESSGADWPMLITLRTAAPPLPEGS